MKTIQIAYDHDFEKKCKYASEGGFRHISVNFHDMDDYSDQSFDEAPERILEILNCYDLQAVQSHPPYYDLFLSAELEDARFEHYIMRSIEVSGKIGVDWCAFHPRTHASTGYNKQLSFIENRKIFSRYLDYAIKYNTGIALENLPSWGDEEGKKFYGAEYTDLAELCDSLDHEKVKICWDFGHANLMPFQQEDALRYLGNRIRCTHIHNNFGDQDYHLPPDSGNIDWQKAMHALNEIGYRGPLTLETHCLYPEDKMLRDFARYNYNCLEYLQRLMR